VTDPQSPQRSIWVHYLLDDLGLDSQAFRVFAHLSRRAGRGLAWPSIESITKTCQLSRNTVAAAILELEERGLIQVERRRGVSNRYRIAPISDWERAARIASPETYPTTPNPNTPTTTKRDTPTTTKRNTPPPPNEIHEVYQGSISIEVLPGSGSREGVFPLPLQPDPKPPALALPPTNPPDTKSFWMLTKQLECNAELLKAMERRGMLDENDKVIFNHASDREEYRRLKAERKALLERTRPQN